MKKYAIIVAGGSGLRMGTETPKQFLLLAGKPVLMHTIEAFYQADPETSIILVLPETSVDTWKKLCRDFHFEIKHSMVSGGDSRFDSVKNGLSAIHDESDSVIAVHDGVRPFPGKRLINEAFEKAASNGNAIPFIEITDSIRERKETNSISVNRNAFIRIQTPQCFRASTLIQAYRNASSKNFTDDAGVIEAQGEKICLIPGEEINIKITKPVDLLLAEFFLKQNEKNSFI